MYGDLLVFNFIDSYHQLSVKSFMTSEYHKRRFEGEYATINIGKISKSFKFFSKRKIGLRKQGEKQKNTAAR
jgi:hypothetical protein